MSAEAQIFIGALASKSGLSRDTLRFYEKEGILRSHRLPNNYRVYDGSDVERLRFVESARASGFSLREVRGILNLIGSGRRSCGDYEELAQKKLADLDSKIAALQECREILNNSLACCKRDDAQCDSLSGV
ncbi:MAG: MerR family transcriptional regulator [Leptospirales bacterium]|nr:MerR family transcriptional regulator [Leptospirales bacterium]